MGVVLTLAAAAFSFLFPNVPNYVFLPGLFVVYALSGGVHGYASGVYLPALPVWYALGGLVNATIYSGLLFAILRSVGKKSGKGPL
ncbi:MAG: hypothetical protein ABSF72_05175 [Candidatus Sulfotelmatobacter sp.]